MAFAPPQFSSYLAPNYWGNGMYVGFTKIGQPVYAPSSGTATQNYHTAVVTLENHLGTFLEYLSVGLPNSISDPTQTLDEYAGCPQHLVWAGPLCNMSGGTLLTLTSGGYNTGLDATGAAFVARRNGGVSSATGHLASSFINTGSWQASHVYAVNTTYSDPTNGDRRVVIAGYTSGSTFGATDRTNSDILDPTDTIRAGWEHNFSNYTWGYKVNGNTYTTIAGALDYYTNRLRLAGYNGRFDLNGGSDADGNYSWNVLWPLITRKDNFAIIGNDFYNDSPFSDSPSRTYQNIWDNYGKAKLDNLYAFALANNRKIGFGECGVVRTSNNFHSKDTGQFWTLFSGWLLSHTALATYYCMYNQQGYVNGNPANATNEDDALFWSQPIGTPASSYTVLGNVQNNSATGPWFDTLSALAVLCLPDYKANMIAGRLQFQDVTQPTAQASVSSSGRKVNNFCNIFA